LHLKYHMVSPSSRRRLASSSAFSFRHEHGSSYLACQREFIMPSPFKPPSAVQPVSPTLSRPSTPTTSRCNGTAVVQSPDLVVELTHDLAYLAVVSCRGTWHSITSRYIPFFSLESAAIEAARPRDNVAACRPSLSHSIYHFDTLTRHFEAGNSSTRAADHRRHKPRAALRLMVSTF